ncbi:MAG: amino acid ABC transporter ATP-binding protein [Thermomicrobiales bacterium]
MSTPRHDGAPLLQIEGLYKAYGPLLVLQNIDLAVREHEVICLIGASGCGKSTLLRCINLLEPIQAGVIVLDGLLITGAGVNEDRVRQEVGMVFQSFNLFPHMTVLENITLAPVKTRGVSRRDAEAEALQLLQRFGLADKAREYPDRLSGGQQQRVAIIRSLAMQPKLLLLDEVTSALDPEMVGEVLEIIAELKGLGMTMILATHQMGFAYQIADRVAFLDAGRIVEIGPARDVLTHPHEARTQAFLQRVLVATPAGGDDTPVGQTTRETGGGGA